MNSSACAGGRNDNVISIGVCVGSRGTKLPVLRPQHGARSHNLSPLQSHPDSSQQPLELLLLLLCSVQCRAEPSSKAPSWSRARGLPHLAGPTAWAAPILYSCARRERGGRRRCQVAQSTKARPTGPTGPRARERDLRAPTSSSELLPYCMKRDLSSCYS